MNLDNEELDVTKLQRQKIKYTKKVATGKGLTADEFKEFYKAYCELYDIMCDYIDKYNKLAKINEKEVTRKELSEMILGMLE